MKKLIIATALLVISGAANAAQFVVLLADDGFAAGNPDDPAGAFTLTGNVDAAATDATWTYDDVSGQLQGTGILTAAIQPFGPGTPIFTHTMVDPSIVGGVASAASCTYACINGGFAVVVNSQVCGNYGFGANFMDDSVFEYADNGRDFTRMIMGDDTDDGVEGVQTIAFMDMSVVQFDGPGGLLVLQTDDWFNDDNGICDEQNPCDSAGAQLTFSVVPVPAAVWLFGSALGMLGWIRRRASA